MTEEYENNEGELISPPEVADEPTYSEPVADQPTEQVGVGEVAVDDQDVEYPTAEIPYDSYSYASHEQDSEVAAQTQKKSHVLLIVAIAVVCFLLGGLIVGLFNDGGTTRVVNRNRTPQVVRTGDIKSVLKVVEPAVVAIETRGVESGNLGAGTGMIINENGTILTNAHVVEGGNSYLVSVFKRDKKYAADLVGIDRSNDVAIIKIRNGSGFPTVKLGKSADMEVGDPVIAIGNALGLSGDPSVTTGIVSAIGRSINTQQEKLNGLIQTDAAINFGNSGGPLVNFNAEVIGINTATADPGYSQNIGFALAIDNIKPLIDDLLKGKNVQNRALLGVSASDVTPIIAQQFNLSVNNGALIRVVGAQSPAAEIGLREGDVVVEVDGQRVSSSSDLREEVSSHKAGEKVEIVWYRGDQRLSGEATLVAQNPA